MALKIIYMGTPDFAVPILQSIKNSGHNILVFILNPLKEKIEAKKRA